MITPKEIESILKDKLSATSVEITDNSHQHLGHQPGNPAYLTVEVTSPEFANKSLIQQHRMVYQSLEKELQEKIHALAIKTKVPS